MEIKRFSDLDAWKVNHELALAIYKITNKFPREELYSLTDQIRRAVASITANIAEGWGRYHYTDRIKFYHQARGSNSEVQNFLILCKDLSYISEAEYNDLYNLAIKGFQIINGLIRSVEKFKAS